MTAENFGQLVALKAAEDEASRKLQKIRFRLIPFEEIKAPQLMSLTFDLSRDIEAQIREARSELLREQGAYLEKHGRELATTKMHPKKWLTYLRLLDARADGAFLSQMAKILPDTLSRRDARAAGNVLRQAQELAFRFNG